MSDIKLVLTISLVVDQKVIALEQMDFPVVGRKLSEVANELSALVKNITIDVLGGRVHE